MNVASPSKSQENTTPKGVNYFKQFPRNLLVPYGSSLDPNDQQKLLKYFQPFNCELLLRPSVFLSEFCSSVSQCLQEVKEEVINVNGLAHGSQNMRDFVAYMEHLKRLVLPLSRDAREPPSKPQVISVLHSLVSNDDDAEETIINVLSPWEMHCFPWLVTAWRREYYCTILLASLQEFPRYQVQTWNSSGILL